MKEMIKPAHSLGVVYKWTGLERDPIMPWGCYLHLSVRSPSACTMQKCELWDIRYQGLYEVRGVATRSSYNAMVSHKKKNDCGEYTRIVPTSTSELCWRKFWVKLYGNTTMQRPYRFGPLHLQLRSMWQFDWSELPDHQQRWQQVPRLSTSAMFQYLAYVISHSIFITPWGFLVTPVQVRKLRLVLLLCLLQSHDYKLAE